MSGWHLENWRFAELLAYGYQVATGDRAPLAREGPRPRGASLRPFPALLQSPTARRIMGPPRR